MKSEKQKIHIERLAKKRKGQSSILKGKKRPLFSAEWRNNMRKAQIKLVKKEGYVNPFKGKKHTIETRKKMSISGKKKIFTKEHRKKLNENHRRYQSEETRNKISQAQKAEKSYNWKGGISSKNDRLRQSVNYKLWREKVYKRDNFTCQICSYTGNKLVAHHINNFADYENLRFVINNGITFCLDCHKEFHKIYGFKNNTKEQVEEFNNKHKKDLLCLKSQLSP